MTHSAACQGSLLEKGLLLGSVTAVRFCLLVLDSCSCCSFMQRGRLYKSSDATAAAIYIGYSGSPWYSSEESNGNAWESGRPKFSYQIFCKWDVWALSSHLPLLSITPCHLSTQRFGFNYTMPTISLYDSRIIFSFPLVWIFQSSSLFDLLLADSLIIFSYT